MSTVILLFFVEMDKSSSVAFNCLFFDVCSDCGLELCGYYRYCQDARKLYDNYETADTL